MDWFLHVLSRQVQTMHEQLHPKKAIMTMERKLISNPEALTEPHKGTIDGALIANGARKLPRFHCCKGKFRLFGHYVHAQFLLLLAVEFLMVATGSQIILELVEPLLHRVPWLLPWHETLLATTITLLSMIAVGLYDTRQREQALGILFRLGSALLLATLFLWAFYQVDTNNYWDPRRHFVFAATAFLLLGITRILFYRFIDGRVLLKHTLVLGTGKRARHIDRLRRHADKRGFKLVGFVAPRSCEAIHVDPAKIVNREGEAFCDYSLAKGADEIVIAVDDRRQKLPIDELLDCRMSGIEVIDAIDFFERERALIHLDLVQPGWLIHAPGFRRNLARDVIKRSFDITVSLVLLLLSSPFSLAAMLAILLEDRGRGGIFYRQERVGLNGLPFEVIKFRSMRPDAESDGQARWAQKNDPRVTRTGAVLRKYRIDEIPQLWNVLRGDMSLVGPRPERPQFVEQLVALNPLYRERHRVKPGLTGWAQLSYPYGSSEEDAMQKLQFDLYYIKNSSLFFDLLILMQTVEVVLFKKGSR